jgi:hypothetical protein
MLINDLLNRIRLYLTSLFFPLTVAVLAFVTWILPGDFSWISAVLYGLISFLPLCATDGRSYMPLILFNVIICSAGISFSTLPPYLYFIAGCVLISLILFIALKKPKFRRGDLMITTSIMFLVFFISYIYNSAVNGKADKVGIFYILALFLCLLVYVLFSTVLGKEETMPYFEETAALLALAISAEVLVYLIGHGFTLVGSDFTLGWSYTSQTASTLLCFTLPFFGMLIARKRFYWIIGEAFVITAIIFLSADSGLLCLILGIIPLLLLSLRNYGRAYPYMALAFIVIIGVTFAVLLGVNDRFNARVLTAIQSLNLFNEQAEWRRNLFETAIAGIRQSPVIGVSITSVTTAGGTVTLASNTILSTMVLGGAFGLIAFLVNEARIYYVVLKKHTEERWLFFLFLLFVELIGLIDNTIDNIGILLFFLTANSCYQMSNRAEDVVIHDSYYQHYDPETTFNR